ncbi:MAG TPA: Hpt domain-containing protein [Chloroflexaceae bacterium]|nr:Hpt domain-containing protein [Chloroflexaceae bacterium]
MLERQLVAQTEALMDPSVLRNFLDLLGPEGPATLRGILESYLKETPPVVEDLGDALFRGDRTRAAWLAHRLRGSCLSLGASRLGARCATLEEHCRANLPPPPVAYAAVVADFTETRRVLKLMLKELA